LVSTETKSPGFLVFRSLDDLINALDTEPIGPEPPIDAFVAHSDEFGELWDAENALRSAEFGESAADQLEKRQVVEISLR
jgi:hypothetical protein